MAEAAASAAPAPAAPKLVLGVTGSIAAVKAIELMRLLQRRGWDVWPVLTACAAQYVAPLAFRALCGHPVPSGDFASQPAAALAAAPYEHLDLTGGAAAMLVAPCTANTLAKLAGGFAGDILSAAALSLEPGVPLLVAPAMNVRMWQHPATRANLDTLRRRGVHVIDPDTGPLACGDTGQGRLAPLETIAEAVCAVLPGGDSPLEN